MKWIQALVLGVMVSSVSAEDTFFALLFPFKTTTNTYTITQVTGDQTNLITRFSFQHEFDLRVVRTNWPTANALSVVKREGDLIRMVGLSPRKERTGFTYTTSSTNEVGILVWKRARENPPIRIGVSP
jgi:hypothetical protein